MHANTLSMQDFSYDVTFLVSCFNFNNVSIMSFVIYINTSENKLTLSL